MSLIETHRTVLRRLTLSDFNNLRELESNPNIMKFAPSMVPQTEAQTLARLKSQLAKQSELEPYGIWAVDNFEDSSFVGWFMLMPASENQLELGFMSKAKIRVPEKVLGGEIELQIFELDFAQV